MPSVLSLRRYLVPIVAVLFAPTPVGAAPSLSEAVKAADARHLHAPDFKAEDNAPKIEAGNGEDAAPKPQEISQGEVRAALGYREEKREDGEAVYIPVITIYVGAKEVAKLEGEDVGFPAPPVSIQIAEMDPGNPHPEVVVSFYTGGAHCCSDTSVVTAGPDGLRWTTVEVGEFDGGPLLAVDLDGDGRYEFATNDNAFLYAFACYACSVAPLQVIGIENGEVKNVTREARFKAAHESWLKGMIQNASDEDVNGFLAGYVSEKILLGEGKQAWDLMLKYYDRNSDWGLTSCNQPLDQDGSCPGQDVTVSFPEALEHMLKENGYNM